MKSAAEAKEPPIEIDAETTRRINQLAAERGITPAEVVRLMLAHCSRLTPEELAKFLPR